MRILLVEDDPLLASGLQVALRQANYLVDHVSDGKMALSALDSHGFDLVILDLGLPKIDGLEVLRTVRARPDHTPVLILSARDSAAHRVQGLDLGADDYLTKPFDLDELKARLRVLERRRAGISSNTLRLGKLEIDVNAMLVTWEQRPVDLQPYEFKLLRKLAENPSQIFSRGQLEEALYGWGEGVESNAINVYVHNLRKKLSSDVIRTIRGIGFSIQSSGNP
jgi:two-component system response regulator QseB|tara:strand:+ start:53 stop:721 length:669 start_codon:yes stop_codon:yes gene_type:complete